jgi:2-oxo-4-hydroxy-4-carboxy-5-ureidoimidazoline decarboxylase
MISLSHVNEMALAAFLHEFGDVAEHSIWVAKEAHKSLPFASSSQMHTAFSLSVVSASKEMQLGLLRAHPDLATRAKLTTDSSGEQKGAGLDTLSPQEFAHFTALNTEYKKRNGFPFIFAVKGATKFQILESFEERLLNTRDAEFHQALLQVCKIIGFRLEARVTE